MFDPEGFNPPAERAIFWTRAQLEAPDGDLAQKERRWSFLADRPRMFRENGFLFVHGSARNPLNEYVFPEDVYNQRKMDRIFALVERNCFQGHTHVPGVFTEGRGEDSYRFHAPDELGYIYKLGEGKMLCNVGSVGQPRDNDWRACYVLFDGESIRFRRLEYDIDTTVRKIYSVPDLDNFLGDRLREGR
jgi:diadenosine tetraphosphatase ApaH/serine/threonine PP2A family protein phosphatase